GHHDAGLFTGDGGALHAEGRDEQETEAAFAGRGLGKHRETPCSGFSPVAGVMSGGAVCRDSRCYRQTTRESPRRGPEPGGLSSASWRKVPPTVWSRAPRTRR